MNKRVIYAGLSEPISDSTDRSMMAMSTLVDDPTVFLYEAPFEDGRIGDIQIFRNLNKDPKGEPDWKWWGGVPAAKIKSYRFAPEDALSPDTVDGLPFELPHAEREAKPVEAGKGGAKTT